LVRLLPARDPRGEDRACEDEGGGRDG